MAARIKRTYRLAQGTLDKLAIIAERERVTATEAIERAVMAYGSEPDESHTESHTQPDGGSQALEALSAELERLHGQLAVKDEQIGRLADALEDAQAATKAAQALHAAATQTMALESRGQAKSRWRRLLDAWRG